MIKELFKLLFVEKTVREFWGPAAFLFLLFLALAAACFYFKDDVMNQSEFIVKRENIRVLDPPSWISGDFVNETLRLIPSDYRAARQKSGDDVAPEPDPNAARFDDVPELEAPGQEEPELNLNSNDVRLAEKLRVAFLKHPLVKDVRSIHVYYPGRVDVRLTFRTPIAIVDGSQKLLEDFQKDVEENFPADYRFVDDMRSSRDALAQEEKDGQETDESPDGSARYLIDQTGQRLPNDYFANHQDAYATLPRVVGLTTSSASAGSEPLLKEASAFARFLSETHALADWQIDRVGVLRAYGSAHGLWFFKTASGTLVKWGRFVPRARTDAESGFASFNAERDWNEIYEFQYGKYEELRKRLVDADTVVVMMKNSKDEEERANAESYRQKVFDVSGTLLGQESESE